MDLGNLAKTVVYYLLIEGMTYLSHWDEVSTMTTLVCMIIHLIRPIMNHDIRLLVVTIH